MSDNAIQALALSKQYRIGAKQERYYTLRDTVTDVAVRPFQKLASFFHPNGSTSKAVDESSIWALKDVSLDVRHGDVVGIIGRNGAGKSTLLKILSRITEPTEGRAKIQGRVGSLLEVGTGFHPELTGRENIYLNGAILGMKKAEINRTFDAIVAFAEVEKFIDTPVKHYSSGMYARLAFAVAAHLEPDILIIDEVLAVGDTAFQKKCLGRMGDVAREGRTVLFVSHNMNAIQNLCTKVAVLEEGKLAFIGDTNDGIRRYMDLNPALATGDLDLSYHPMRPTTCVPLLKRIRLIDRSGNVTHRFLSHEPMNIELTLDPAEPLVDPQFGIGVDDWMGARIFSLATYLSNSKLPPLLEPCKIICSIEHLPLTPGRYFLSLSAGTHYNRIMDNMEHAVTFEVEPSDLFGLGNLTEPWVGKVLVPSQWEKMKDC